MIDKFLPPSVPLRFVSYLLLVVFIFMLFLLCSRNPRVFKHHVISPANKHVWFGVNDRSPVFRIILLSSTSHVSKASMTWIAQLLRCSDQLLCEQYRFPIYRACATSLTILNKDYVHAVEACSITQGRSFFRILPLFPGKNFFVAQIYHGHLSPNGTDHPEEANTALAPSNHK